LRWTVYRLITRNNICRLTVVQMLLLPTRLLLILFIFPQKFGLFLDLWFSSTRQSRPICILMFCVCSYITFYCVYIRVCGANLRVSFSLIHKVVSWKRYPFPETKDRQFRCNVTLRHVRVTIVAVERQYLLHILSVSVYP